MLRHRFDSILHRTTSIRLSAAILLAIVAAAPAFAEPVRVMTFNIRYGTAPDGENAWPHRRDLVEKVIREYDPDVIGLQEALRSQLDELRQALPEYSKVGVGREAGGGGEYSAVFYRAARFDLSDAGTFWLSDTPETPGSRSWGNNLPRICTWARLFDRTNERRFLVFNTHWDHESQPARLASGTLLGQRVQKLCAGAEPAIVTGDFNAAPQNPAFVELLTCGDVQDTFRVIHADETDVGTFNGFGKNMQARKIDAVLVTNHWRVQDAAIVRTRDGQRYPSDHFPVTATIELP
jgi:endonuclease/exonuclease/phosphatase family metal-dependent hydrolase